MYTPITALLLPATACYASIIPSSSASSTTAMMMMMMLMLPQASSFLLHQYPAPTPTSFHKLGLVSTSASRRQMPFDDHDFFSDDQRIKEIMQGEDDYRQTSQVTITPSWLLVIHQHTLMLVHIHTQEIEAKALDFLAQCPFIAVLRGIDGANIERTFNQLIDAGLTMLSIPAEAPAGLKSLRAIQHRFGTDQQQVMIGAATVISVEQVDEAADHGASFISCPHTDPEIIRRYVEM